MVERRDPRACCGCDEPVVNGKAMKIDVGARAFGVAFAARVQGTDPAAARQP